MSSICGFSFGRNLIKLNYPAVESVRSILPICDRFVFAVGKSDDDTRDLVASIDPKIEIIDTEWPDVKVDGKVLSIEANKAMEAATATGCTWGFYIQGDEVVHEDDLPNVQSACERWADDPEAKALLFWYLHFVQDYQTTDPWMYHKACRIVRLDNSCHIVDDACGPALKEWDGPRPYLDKHHMGKAVRWAKHPSGGGPARIFHYGWVQTRDQLEAKLRTHEELWWGDLSPEQQKIKRQEQFGKVFARYGMLKNFKKTHPKVMAERIAAHPPYRKNRNRWLNPRFYAEVLRHGFHG